MPGATTLLLCPLSATPSIHYLSILSLSPSLPPLRGSSQRVFRHEQSFQGKQRAHVYRDGQKVWSKGCMIFSGELFKKRNTDLRFGGPFRIFRLSVVIRNHHFLGFSKCLPLKICHWQPLDTGAISCNKGPNFWPSLYNICRENRNIPLWFHATPYEVYCKHCMKRCKYLPLTPVNPVKLTTYLPSAFRHIFVFM